MEMSKACELFGISDLREMTFDYLKKTRRRLMKQFHPDNNNGSDKYTILVNEAYEVLESYLNSKVVRIGDAIDLVGFSALEDYSNVRLVKIEMEITLENETGLVEKQTSLEYFNPVREKKSTVKLNIVSNMFRLGESFYMTIKDKVNTTRFKLTVRDNVVHTRVNGYKIVYDISIHNKAEV